MSTVTGNSVYPGYCVLSLYIFRIDPESFAEIREAVFKRMTLISVDQMPVLAQFVLENSELDKEMDSLEVSGRLRDSLVSGLTCLALTQSYSQADDVGRNISDGFVLLFHVVSSVAHQKKHLSTAFIKTIEQADQHKSVDLVLLVVLHAINPRVAKQCETLFRAKVRSGHFNESHVKTIFKVSYNVHRNPVLTWERPKICYIE